MPGNPDPIRSLEGRHGANVRWNKSEARETARDLAAARIEAYVTKTLEKAPPLTPSQRRRIHGLLSVGGDA